MTLSRRLSFPILVALASCSTGDAVVGATEDGEVVIRRAHDRALGCGGSGDDLVEWEGSFDTWLAVKSGARKGSYPLALRCEDGGVSVRASQDHSTILVRCADHARWTVHYLLENERRVVSPDLQIDGELPEIPSFPRHVGELEDVGAVTAVIREVERTGDERLLAGALDATIHRPSVAWDDAFEGLSEPARELATRDREALIEGASQHHRVLRRALQRHREDGSPNRAALAKAATALTSPQQFSPVRERNHEAACEVLEILAASGRDDLGALACALLETPGPCTEEALRTLAVAGTRCPSAKGVVEVSVCAASPCSGALCPSERLAEAVAGDVRGDEALALLAQHVATNHPEFLQQVSKRVARQGYGLPGEGLTGCDEARPGEPCDCAASPEELRRRACLSPTALRQAKFDARCQLRIDDQTKTITPHKYLPSY